MNGFIENLDPDLETGVRFQFRWLTLDGDRQTGRDFPEGKTIFPEFA